LEKLVSAGFSKFPLPLYSAFVLRFHCLTRTLSRHTTQMAREHGLWAQLDALNLRRENWYIADLPAEGLRRAQAAAGERASPRAPLLEAAVAVAAGRAGLPLRRRLLRLPVWFVPCPEAQLLLLDWAWFGGGRPR